MAKKNDKDQGAGKPKKRVVTPDVKRVTKPRKAPSTASRKPAERRPVKARSSGFVVRGQVLQGGNPYPGALVSAVDQDRRGENQLGEPTHTDKQGRYEISYTEGQYRRSKKEIGGPDLIVRVYSTDGQLMAQSKRKNDAGRDETVNISVDKTLPPAPQKAAFVVRGIVRHADGSPCVGALVRAYALDLRKRKLLGKKTTGADGSYAIPYTADKFSSAEKGSADLHVCVVNEKGHELVFSELSNAPAEALLDLSLPAEPERRSEFELLVNAIQPLLEGQGKGGQDLPIVALEEKDFSFLVKETGQPQERIAFLVAAAKAALDESPVRKSDPPSIPLEAFYGWFRQGLSLDRNSLLERPTLELITELRKSIEANFVPRVLSDRLEVIEATLNLLRAARTLEPAPDGKPSSLGDLLGTLPGKEALSDKQRLTFAKLHDQHGDTDNLWTQAKVSGLSKAIPALKRTLALDKLTAGHASLVHALQTKSDAKHPESVEFLTTLEPTDWIELVFEHGVPPGSGLDRDGYIEQLQADVEGKFPTQILAKQLERSPSKSESFPTGKVVDFLKANPGFDLRTQHVEPYLIETDNRDDPLREGLLQLQRIHALTSNARETGVLLDAGFASSTQIISEGKPAFELKVAGQLAPERTGEVFAAAEYVVTTVVALGTAYVSPVASGNAVQVVPARKVGDVMLENYPSLRSLFGDLDYCECPHCQSVLGPAAYLADLMHFLQRSPLKSNPDGSLSDANNSQKIPLDPYLEYAAGGTVLGALLQRRPDLADLELSCENTDTEIPYIDLVLEILENAVVLPLAVDPAAFAGIDIDAEFSAGNVPVKIAEALHKTDIQVGKVLHVTPDDYLGANSPLRNWIITDGSRRWLVQHQKQQFILFTNDLGVLQVLDVADAARSLELGKLNAELEDKLAQGLPISGAPVIREVVPMPRPLVRGWTASYTRAVAIKITMGNPMGAVALLKLDGTQLKAYQWPTGTMQVIAHAFTSGATSKINPNVATLLALPANETYLQTWNPAKNWWELSIKNTALFAHFLEGCYVSGLTYQNSSVREHLESSPENRNPAAYDILAQNDTVFPWALPFDLWLEETRAFLEALGIPRAPLIDLARPQSRLSEDAATLELLGLSKSDADLITPATVSTEPWIYWGLAEKNNTVQDHAAGFEWNGNWLEVLVHLSMLLQQSGLSYREYLDLLQTRFVGQPKLILLPPNECQTSQISIAGLEPTEFTDHLNRIHVFTRLWRKSGWSMRELDLVLAAFGGQPTPIILQDLALLQRLQAGSGLPVSILVACIDKLETQAWTDHTKDGSPLKPALYDSVFQRKSLRSLSGFDDFSLEKLGNPTLRISDRADFVAASLGIKPEQVKAWISGTPNLGIADLANLDSLSRLYAAASLCGALRIAPEALPDIVTLLLGAAAGPTDPAGPFRTLPAPTTPDEIVKQTRGRERALFELVERIGFVRESGFDFETLSYLLQHRVLAGAASDAGTRIELQLTQTLTELRAALQAGNVLGDVSADNLKRQLARLGWYPALVEAAMGSDGLNYQPGASVEITLPLVSEPVIPLNLRSKFTYQELDSTKATLKCVGSLIASDFATIENENLNLFPAGRVAALETQYNQQLQARAEALASLLQVIELEELPQLDEVISGVTVLPVIPGELVDRLKFEMTSATAGKLRLTGWLTASEMQALSEANPALSAALSSLQTRALAEIPAPSQTTLADAERMLHEPDGAERCRAILLRLVPHLELDLVTALLSTALGSDPQVVGRLLDAAKVNARSAKVLLTDSEFLRSAANSLIDRKTWPDQFAVLELLGKIATLANRLTVRPEQLDWLLGGVFTVLDVLALPTGVTTAATAAANFDGWRKLVDLFHLRDVMPDGAKHLAHVYEALKAHKHHYEALVRAVFARALALGPHLADGVCDAGLLNFNITAPALNDYNDPSRLLELAQLLQVSKLLGTPCSQIERLIQPGPDQSVAQLARTLFAASIDANAFPERLRPISDRLRNLQRDALVAYLIHRDHLDDSNELFDRYLIDVEMGPCMLTSRIKQAISSVQLFVQRCLLNLERSTKAGEPGVSPDCIDTQRWQWMKFYRVWEANRKIFLYPENWIEPELRDDKTEIFLAFESDLLQSELTHETALVAFRKYLDKLADVVNLTVVSMFEEQLTDPAGYPAGSIVHLVGRDNTTPYKHYYRQWKLPPGADFGTWTAWEEVSIQADSEHIMVFLYGGSVYLAWPTISSGQTGHLKWKIGMNLAKRTASGWTKHKKARGEIESPMVPTKDERTSLAFRIMYPPAAADGTVSIDAYGSPYQNPGLEPNETQREAVYDVYNPLDGQTRFGDIYIRDPFLNLNLRVLDSYVYEYAGKVKQAHYELSKDLRIKIAVTFTVTYPGNWPNSYINPPEERTYDVPESNTVSYRGLFSFSKFIKLSMHTWTTDSLGKTDSTLEMLVDVLKIKVTVLGSSSHKTPDVTKEFHISKGTSFSWQEDFVFERLDDPKLLGSPDWLPSGGPNLVNAGLFTLKDDDSLELDSNTAIAWPLNDVQANTQNFMSGFQEFPGADALALEGTPSNTASLNTTPGQYFIVRAQSDSISTRKIWSYRDDQFSLLFWRNSPAFKFRVVPFSVGGMLDLKSDVTKGRLLHAVALPGTLAPIPIDVGTGIDFVRDSVTQLDTTNSNSVTEVKIDFEKVPGSIYNWEVFFHNPLLVATQLSQAQRFEEAQRWFHLIFDPTTNDPAPESIRYWRFLPFREAGQGDSIDKLLQGLAQGKDVAAPKFTLTDAINEWAENPFRPHLVARHRLRSYQFAVVQKYLENLIAWGDQLFRRDTIESINEATQLYVLAAKILGKRPVSSPRQGTTPKSYRDIYRKLDDFSNAWIPLEQLIATQSTSGQMRTNDDRHLPGTDLLNSIGSLYFCIPGNEKLAEYWDTVDDRLFKIRHCMNIEGIERQLPLFEPPIDPALLVRATAAGLDLAAVLSDLQAPLPLYRFNVMLQKALELCGEVRALGNALLSALEKKDAEQLSLLRSSHEIQMLKLVREIKEQQQKEAETNLEALRKTREVTAQRYLNYQRLMGKQNVVVPAEGTVATLESSTLQLAPPGAGDTDTEGLALISAEASHMGWLNDANNYALTAGIFNTLGGISHALPNNTFGSLVESATWGGSNLGNAFNSVGSLFSTLAANAGFQANRSSTIGGYQRRYDEWQFQSNTAARELEQIDKLILANEIRIKIAEIEIANHDQQMENTQEVDEFMRDKFTNQQLYSWLVGQISSVFFRTYQLAHDISKRVERTYRFELGLKDSDSSFIEFGYWDSLKKGLLSGERLYLDLKRMEGAYLDKNKREYEIAKHVSVMQLDPMALLQLKETGQCDVSLPEALLDMDFPGHYLRRIKSVSLTIPCVTGPYSSVPCTLTLLKHSVRHSSSASGNYARDIENDDPRFIDSFGAIQSIVTSSAQNDSGLFETNLRDERYLPFEGAGVISTWQIQLPTQFRSFDYDTISDVVLHLRYTAREGGELLRQHATAELSELVNSFVQPDGQAGLARIFSLRHEFPTEWHRFLNPDAGSTGNQTLTMPLTKDRFPFLFQDRITTIDSMELFVKVKPEFSVSHNDSTLKLSLAAGATAPTSETHPLDIMPLTLWNGLVHTSKGFTNPPGAFTLNAWLNTGERLDPNAIQDILVVCHYTCR